MSSRMRSSAVLLSPASRACRISGRSLRARSSSIAPSRRGGASNSSTKSATPVGERTPTNSATTRPSLNPLTAGIPWMPYSAESAGSRRRRSWRARRFPSGSRPLARARESVHGMARTRPPRNPRSPGSLGIARPRLARTSRSVTSIVLMSIYNVQSGTDHPLTTSAPHPAMSAPRTCSAATPSRDRCERSISAPGL